MAKCYSQKARKEYVCNKCGKPIHKGDQYFKIEAMYAKTKYRCCDCKPERSELTSSEYLSWLYDLQDHVSERYDLRSEEGKDELYSELENMRDDLQGHLDDMPEQLQAVGSGEILSTRIDSLDSAMSTIEDLEFPDEEDEEFQKESDELICVEVSTESTCCEELEDFSLHFVDLTESDVAATCYVYDFTESERSDTTRGEDVEIVTYTNEEGNSIVCTYKHNIYFDEDAYNEAIDAFECEIADAISEISE